MDIAEIDTFMREGKTLLGSPPQWEKGARPNELSATWSIADEVGFVRAQLRFRCPSHGRQSHITPLQRELDLQAGPCRARRMEAQSAWRRRPGASAEGMRNALASMARKSYICRKRSFW
jgi:hypothetical protein